MKIIPVEAKNVMEVIQERMDEIVKDPSKKLSVGLQLEFLSWDSTVVEMDQFLRFVFKAEPVMGPDDFSVSLGDYVPMDREEDLADKIFEILSVGETGGAVRLLIGHDVLVVTVFIET